MTTVDEARAALHAAVPSLTDSELLLDALIAAVRAESAGRREPLDVERLARALINGLLPLRHWFMDGETTTENFARWLAAEYARLAKDAEPERTAIDALREVADKA